MSVKPLAKRLQPALKALEKDLLDRAKLSHVEAGLRAAWEAEKTEGETGQSFDAWRRARVTQIAAAWVLSVVFVRTLEDRGFIDPRIAGPDANRLAAARDREGAFVQIAPFLGPREYLLAVFRELSHLPGARDVFDARHNPVWVLAPSSEGAQKLLDFFQHVDAMTGMPVFTFPGHDTRFLGDLYQNLSEAVRKRYALLQTPEFIEKFILEQTLHPAINEFGLAAIRLIDPTCGSGHFLLGAFRDLLAAWQKQEPATPIEDLARRALEQVYGVDINPYAVAIARFRLVLAVLDAVGITWLEKAPTLRPKVVVADSLLHRMVAQQRLSQQLPSDEWASWGDGLFRLAEPGAVAMILQDRYQVVVGNPPYITEKDAKKRSRFRQMYESAANHFALAAPFTERFFDLASSAGFVGLINSNAWTKRDYGRPLVEKVLPRVDIRKVIDTSGCYLPGHGTPTLLLFGRNRASSGADIAAVHGKRGEREVPRDPERAPVWSEIVQCHDVLGFEGRYVSTESISRSELRHHPWIMAGGGARTLLNVVTDRRRVLASIANVVRYGSTSADDFYSLPRGVFRRAGVAVELTRPILSGDSPRDWSCPSESDSFFPYTTEGDLVDVESLHSVHRLAWPLREVLLDRATFGGGTYRSEKLPWWRWHQVSADTIRAECKLVYGEVSTHNHFVCVGRVFVCKQSAPVVILKGHPSRSDYASLLGYLNSSLVGFWGRLNFFPKGGDQVGEGARLSKTPWQDRLQIAINRLQQLPVPELADLRDTLGDIAVAAEQTVRALGELAPDKVILGSLAANPTLAGLREARQRVLAEHARLRGILVSLQEEIDWRVYGLFGLPTITAPGLDAVRVPVDPEHRPFEVRLAREVHDDISAYEWFRIHKRQAPSDVGGLLSELYRQRLRLLDDPEHGRQLRLLETPETKRRWSPVDDLRAFNQAVRAWLLERIEATFREQSIPELRTERQIAIELGRDPGVQAAHELLAEETGLDLVHLVADLVDAEGVPFSAGWRYTEAGMEKRAMWEETWWLQRLEDQGTLTPELNALGLPAIPVPDKYGQKDFQRHYWSLRGKLDVPKERFVTVPEGNNDDDPTPLVGWAGWDHLQMAQALAALYQRRKTEDDWPTARLVPLLSGLAERVPWLVQWHDQPSDSYGGMKLGQFFRDFVAGEAHALGVAVDFTKATDDLRSWIPPVTPRRTTLEPDDVYAALLTWKPEIDEDAEENEDVEVPEGPTTAELASELGARKALVDKAVKKLIADGRIEKLDGRPARYLAIGGEA